MVIFVLLSASMSLLFAEERAPEILTKYLPVDQVIKGNVVTVRPPEEIKKYIEKVKLGAQKNPKWYAEYAQKAKHGVPLPFHENLGLSKDEYQKYRKLWSQRKFKVIQPIEIHMRPLGDKWMILFSENTCDLSLLQYNSEEDAFDGTGKGQLSRIKDIEADAESILGAWKGPEWQNKKKSQQGRTEESFAIGKEADGKNGLINYRIKKTTPQGAILSYENMVIRFPLPPEK